MDMLPDEHQSSTREAVTPQSEDVFLELAITSPVNDENQVPRVHSKRSIPRGLHSKTQSISNVSAARRAVPSPALSMRPRSSGQLFDGGDIASDQPRPELFNFPTDSQHGIINHPTDSSTRATQMGRQNSPHKKYSTVKGASISPTREGERARTPLSRRFDHRRQSFGFIPRTPAPPFDALDFIQEPAPGETVSRKHSVHDSASLESQTAASTVWDELDELKSRIRKLEVIGQSNVESNHHRSASDHEERPRTATTAPTTIDSSPKQTETIAQPNAAPSAPKGIESDAHPLLRAALVRAKSVISSPLYRALDATVADALQLASMSSLGGTQRITPSPAPASLGPDLAPSERQVRRKVDSMCRNLTDLCLALCELRSDSLTGSYSSTPPSIPNIREISAPRYRGSFGANDAPSPALARRPVSRLDARRSSILGAYHDQTSLSQNQHDEESAIAVEPLGATASRLKGNERSSYRSSSLLRGTHHDMVTDDDDLTMRPASRAFTDYGSVRRRANISRDFHIGVSSSPVDRSASAMRLHQSSKDERARELSRFEPLHSEIHDEKSVSPIIGDLSRRATLYAQPRRQASIGGRDLATAMFRGTELPTRTNSFGRRRSFAFD